MAIRILFLSDIDSAHTRKWAVSLSQRGYEIGVFSLKRSESGWCKQFPNIRQFDELGFGKEKFSSGLFSKLAYLKQIPALKRIIAQFKPDIIHAHYATSYGLLGARTGFHPFVISVWGSDVFDFPKSSWLNKQMLIYNLKRADRIFSTSHVMKTETARYVNREIQVTPFGVDVELFCKRQVDSLPELAGAKIIGIIKSLEDKYGIDVLIRAFALVKKQYKGPLKLVIAGEGSKQEVYRTLATELDLKQDVFFTGRLKSEDVSDWHNRFDVFVSPSVLDSESFGVSVVEAMACEKPVVVSAVAGLSEVVKANETGLIVPVKDEIATAAAIVRFLNDSSLAESMGKKGRARVLELYNWQKNLDYIEELYSAIMPR
jgi:L-malate glycosyltransferase